MRLFLRYSKKIGIPEIAKNATKINTFISLGTNISCASLIQNKANKSKMGTPIEKIKIIQITTKEIIEKGTKYLNLVTFTLLVFLFFKPPKIAIPIKAKEIRADQLPKISASE
ncbi:Uncharacterised protein [Mesomycoplasma hyorhinis]|nr:Uncharacterised protein [Mesomycoplasma hyorhinis]